MNCWVGPKVPASEEAFQRIDRPQNLL